jgi:hypothetical protein
MGGDSVIVYVCASYYTSNIVAAELIAPVLPDLS